MVRNIWFHRPIASMTGTKLNLAVLKSSCCMFTHLEILRFVLYILTSPCYLQVSIKFQQKYQIVQILPTKVSLNIKIAQIINAGRSLDASSKSFDESKKSFSFSIRQNVIKTHHNHIRNISPCYVPDLRSSRQSWLHWGLIDQRRKRCSHVYM